jgi:hypothetical protein
MATALLTVAADALLTAGTDDGIYLIVPVVFLARVGGVADAWIFLMSDLD